MTPCEKLTHQKEILVILFSIYKETLSIYSEFLKWENIQKCSLLPAF